MSESTARRRDFGTPVFTRLSAIAFRLFKRLMDILVAALGLLLLWPFFIYIAWLIRGDSPGPAFFRSPRMGKGGRQFRMLKFRTMYERHESYSGPKVTAQDDPRITPLGKWLRDTKLNELPQLWNVLKGEMSLVGPRPEDPDIVAGWPVETQKELLSMRPGVTSPASVVYRHEESLMNNSNVIATYLEEIVPSKQRLDQLYVRNCSIWSDLDVIFWTFLTLVPRVQTATPQESWLYVGPVWRLMRRYVNWFTIDILVTFLAIGITGLVWRSFGALNVGWNRSIGLALGFALLFSLTGALMGMNRVDWSKAEPNDAFDLILPVVIAAILALALNNLVHTTLYETWLGWHAVYWSERALLPRGLILTAASLAFIGFVATRYRGRLITGLASRWVSWRVAAAPSREKVLVVGGGETGQFAIHTLSDERYTNSLQVIGLVDDNLFSQGVRIQGVKVLGQRLDIPRIVQEQDIGIVVFAIHNIRAAERRRILEICTSTPARVVVFPDLHGAVGHAIQAAGGGGGQTGNGRQGQTDFDPLPCNLCLVKISPLKVDEWLNQLSSLAEQGSLEQVRKQILELRVQISEDVAVQSSANLGESEL